MCKWLVEDEDIEDVHGALVRHHRQLTSRRHLISGPFGEAVGVAGTAIAQARIAGSQGDPSNPQRFRTHHPPTSTGGGDSMVEDHWFMQIEKVLEAMEVTSDATRIRLAAF